MKTKLTLSIDKTVLTKAKKAAKKENKSLSELVEGYLKKRYTTAKSLTPITDSLSGIIPDNGKTYDEMRYDALKEKYGL